MTKLLCLAAGTPPASCAFCWPADGALIGLTQTRQMTSGLVDHTVAQSMQQVPGGCITSNAQLPLALCGADSWCVCRHQIGCPEPLSDRDYGSGAGLGQRWERFGADIRDTQTTAVLLSGCPTYRSTLGKQSPLAICSE